MKQKIKKKSHFLSHFLLLYCDCDHSFLCLNHCYYYHFVYHHYDNQYFCFRFYHFVGCSNITFKNSWYIFSVHGWCWLWNRETCQRQGGDLISIETEEEWKFINDEIQRRNTLYNRSKWSIGLTKKAGNWTWVSERPLTIRKWGKGEPSGEHDAAFMYKWFSNGTRAVFGSVNSTSAPWQAYVCEISKGKLLLLFFFCLFCSVLFFPFLFLFIIILSQPKGTRSAQA